MPIILQSITKQCNAPFIELYRLVSSAKPSGLWLAFKYFSVER